MKLTIEGVPHISIDEAAEELATTHLRVLMLLKHRVVTGCQVEGAWYVEAGAVASLKAHGTAPPEPARCASSCGAATCGCHG